MNEVKRLSLTQRLKNIVSVDAYIKETAFCTIDVIFPNREKMERFICTANSFLEQKIHSQTSYLEMAKIIHALFADGEIEKAKKLMTLLLENAKPFDMPFDEYNRSLNAMFPGNEKNKLRNNESVKYHEESLRVVLATEIQQLKDGGEYQLLKELFIDPYYDLKK